MEPLYTAVAHATGDGRNGHTRTGDGMLDLELPVPTEMGAPAEPPTPSMPVCRPPGYGSAAFHSAPLDVVALFATSSSTSRPANSFGRISSPPEDKQHRCRCPTSTTAASTSSSQPGAMGSWAVDWETPSSPTRCAASARPEEGSGEPGD